MKRILTSLFMTAALGLTAQAQVEIKKWDFNTPIIGDSDRNTGTMEPASGVGTPAEAIGGVGFRFGTVAGGSSEASSDSSMLRLGTNLGGDGFPAATNANKTAGLQLMVNTAGYQNIKVSWEQENSDSASKYWRVQYTTNGVDWIDDAVVIANPLGPVGNETGTPTWQILNNDFTGKPGVDNNPNFGFRLVSEFESTATGSGTNAYVANSGGTYGTSGTMWLDLFTFTGDDLDGSNVAPTVSEISDITVLMQDAISQVSFTVADTETPAANLTTSVYVSNPALINSATLGGSGDTRTLNLTAATGAAGTSIVTVRATDAGGKVGESSFYVTVLPPLISKIPYQLVPMNGSVVIPFSITNLPGDPSGWVVTGNSSDQTKVTDASLVFGGSGANRTLTITPQADVLGTTVVTLVAVTGDRQATTNFLVKLMPAHVVAYNLTAIPNSPVVSAPVTFVTNGLSATALVRGPTVGATGLTRGFSGNNWNNATASRANALLGDYFEFTVTVEPGFTASLAALDVSLRRSAIDAPRNFEWLFSFDGFTNSTTIVPKGTGWEQIGWTGNTFTYLGRSAAGTNGTPDNYMYMTARVDGQDNGNPIPTIDLSDVTALQNIPAGTTITFRLLAWGTTATADSNTLAMGRDFGPYIRGIVSAAATPVTLTIARSGSNVQISWPSSVGGTLEKASSLDGPWTTASGDTFESFETTTMSIPANAGIQFFRLRQ